MANNLQEHLTLRYDDRAHRRIVAGKEVIIHCHHYNARLQRTVESVAEIDGAQLMRRSAEAVFAEQLQGMCADIQGEADRYAAATALYGHLGYGKLDFSQVADGVVTASESHFVEGWRAGAKAVERSVCTFAEGYIQGAIAAATGATVSVRETACMNTGAEACQFEVTPRDEPLETHTKHGLSFAYRVEGSDNDSNIDEQAIIDALVAMPIHGNDDGLIPAFGVYLANTPADFYNLLTLRFVEEMKAHDMLGTARRLLVEAGETCAMNTFRGIMNSPEWEGLVKPMVKEERDTIFGLVALSNGFGWGNWKVRGHDDEEELAIESLNGYEAIGYREYQEVCEEPRCFMLAGVSAGMMELVYAEGSLDDRYGTYAADETACICSADDTCHFTVEAV